MSRIDPAALAAFNAGVARARLHAKVLPIATVRGMQPWCAGDCGRRVPHTRCGQLCTSRKAANETRRNR